MSFTLPALKYEKTALGFISENTLNFHHGKHLQTYIDTTFNNAAQSWNHEFYFNCISPETKAPSDKVLALINENFESLDDFKQKFAASAVSNFGSGWTWLVQTGPNKLKIMNTSNAANPIVDGFTPILVVDVWEHAYYLDYQNRRADYVKDFLEHIDWDFVASQLRQYE